MFRPAGYYSDSEEDSDFDYDFCYSKSAVKNGTPRTEYSPPVMVENNDDLLYKGITEGDLTEVKRVLDLDRYLLTGCLRQGWPVLLLACSAAQYEIVKYLLEERRLDVNQPYGLNTALMAACESKRNPESVLKVAELLLEFGAVINCKDSYGMTPLMFAIVNDHTEVVRMIIDQAAIEATDNEGLTALFHAINNRREEVVRMLLKAGAMTDIVNRRGFTPKQEAEFRGYDEIVELFPTETNFFNIPSKYLGYAHYHDITQGETGEEMPGYHQEIGLLLYGMYSEQHLTKFAREDFNLLRFLTLTDEDLKTLDFNLPFERKKILFGLIKFHRHAWSKRSMKKFSANHQHDSYDILEMLCNHLKQLTIIQSSLIFVAQLMPAEEFKGKFNQELVSCLQKVNQLQQAIGSIDEEMRRINAITAPPLVLHIEKHRSRSGQFCWFTQALKVSLLSAVISLLVYNKIRA